MQETKYTSSTTSANTRRKRRRDNRLPVVPKPNRDVQEMTPRDKVLKVLRLFSIVHKELVRESNSTTTPIDHEARRILLESGKRVNSEDRVGPVPGVEIGDQFTYKVELNLVGLHFGMMRGISSIGEGEFSLATSIVSSEGSGYDDQFDRDVVSFCSQGGTKDHELVEGNLALANSTRAKNPVRLVRGKKKTNQRAKRFVYDGLYKVEDYKLERGPAGNLVYRFNLCRVPDQPSVRR